MDPRIMWNVLYTNTSMHQKRHSLQTLGQNEYVIVATTSLYCKLRIWLSIRQVWNWPFETCVRDNSALCAVTRGSLTDQAVALRRKQET